MRIGNWLEIKTVQGNPVTAGSHTIIPESQAVILRLPRAAFVWNRPLAVVAQENGQTRRIPIVDVTLIARLALLGLTLIFTAAALSRPNRKEQ